MNDILKHYKVMWTSESLHELSDKFKEILSEGKDTSKIDALFDGYPILPSFVKSYFYALYYKDINDFDTAAKYIIEAEAGIDEETIVDFDLRPLRKKFWGQAGEIYAAVGMDKESIRSYKNYICYFSQIKSDAIPKGVLSFRSISDHSLVDLINDELTVSSPKRMNDPFDTLLLHWGDYYKKQNSTIKKHSLTMAKAFEYYRIRCFCKVSNRAISNTLMWSHYAKNHTGMCIHYVFSDRFVESINASVCRFKEIKYAKKREKVRINTSSIDTDFGLCTKQGEWRYENEVRLICYMPDEENLFVPLKIDDKSYIKAIYFGINCPQHDIDTVKKILFGKHIKYYKMESDTENIYKLKAVRI